MVKIKFDSNLPSIPKPWEFKQEYFDGIPNEPGVYIVGVKIEVNDSLNPVHKPKVEKFCPLIVGQTSTMRDRIIKHYCWNGYLNGHKELFNLTRDITDVYIDIKNWNVNWLNTRKHRQKNKTALYNSISCQKTGKNTLIWFNCNSFFDPYLKLKGNKKSKYKANSGHFGSIGTGQDLDTINTADSSKLKNLIIDVKNIISNKFWFAYTIIDKDLICEMKKDKSSATSISATSILEAIESTTKWELKNQYLIPTYATNSGIGVSVWKDLAANKQPKIYAIELKPILKELVNLTGQAF